jgi:hypothetical protein
MRVRTSVRMASSPSHISFPVFLAALRAGRLSWILEHAAQITMGPEYEVKVCELIAAKDPQHLLPGSAKFAERVVVLSEQGVDR